jgi:hypothetical protein
MLGGSPPEDVVPGSVLPSTRLHYANAGQQAPVQAVAIRRSHEFRRQVTDGAVESQEEVPQKRESGIILVAELRDSLAEHRHGCRRERARPNEKSPQTRTPPQESAAAVAHGMNPDKRLLMDVLW